MSFFSMVHQLLIGPLIIMFEFIYKAFIELLQNHGFSIICMSLVMNFLLLPLYKRADAIQDAEREQEKAMADSVAHIKKTFQGDERFMMLQTYYRQNHYKPFYVLKGFLPLVLEIPFFIAAYQFLSNYTSLSGTAFGPIKDLGSPDQLLTVFGLTINVLPVLMTLINCISSAIYTRGFPLKDKIQLYAMAALFLVLLYDSPAGLVIYWTLNNLFSLVKNLVTRLAAKHPRQKKARAEALPLKPVHTKLFVCGCILLAVLTGALIPSAVIESSPQEFTHALNYYSPLRHVLNASLLSFGLFVIWFGIFYYMFTPRGKRIFSAVIWVLCGTGVVNYMFFGTGLGLLSAELYYDRIPVFALKDQLINVGVVAALIALAVLIWRKKAQIALWITVIMMIAVAGMSGWNIIRIQSAMAGTGEDLRAVHTERAQIRLSSGGKNVIVFMLDAAISSYVPYIMAENPELQQQFAGFTYYPNTVSFGKNTNHGTPALFGGYEYTPEEINKRNGESLAEKQNEALLVMPRLFRNAGYRVTVCDPPYAGYTWIPDLSIFDGYEGIEAYHTEQGQFMPTVDAVLDQVWQRNFFCYALMKTVPLPLQPAIYQNGSYLNDTLNVHTQFEKSYGVLKALPDITVSEEGTQDTYLALSNSATHEPVMLSLPDYGSVVEDADPLLDSGKSLMREAEGREPIELSSAHVRKYYMSDTGALLRIGAWLDRMRELGVYDNTRIIIASDHGRNLGLYDSLIVRSDDDSLLDILSYNALLMVKDFNSREFTTDMQLMTLGDVPELAMDGLIESPVNPFTGKPLRSIEKNGTKLTIFSSDEWSATGGNTFPAGEWYTVHDDILDTGNWEKLGEW